MAAYNAAEKSLLSVAFIPCAVLQAIIYRVAKQSFKKPSDSTARRMEVWFSAMSGILLGTFAFKTLPRSNGYLLMAMVMAAFYGLMWVDKLGRVWKYSTAYSGLTRDEANESLHTDILLDTKQMVLTDYLETKDMSSPDYGRDMTRAQSANQTLDRRGRSAMLLYALMIFLCIVDGLYLIVDQPLALGGTAGMVACFWIDKMLESLVVASILVHGHYHVMESPQHRWFWVLCGVWCLTIIMSTVPVLSAAAAGPIVATVQHPAMGVCYALAGGCIFYTTIYFVFVNREQADRCDMIWRLLAFGVGLWVPFVTSLFM